MRVSLARTAMWLQSLPRVANASPAGLNPSALAPWMVDMHTAWGRLRRLGPIERMSATPPHWSAPPLPLGNDPASW